MRAFDLNPENESAYSAGAGLLAPSEALDRFQPPGVLSVATEEKIEAVRYGVRVSSLGFMIAAGIGSEAVELPSIWHIPNSPHWLLGIMNLRGNLVPIFDLKLALELEHDLASTEPMVLVLDKGEKAVGILIDGNPRPVKSLTALAQLPQLPEKLNRYVPKGFHDQTQVWLEFDHEGFFDSLVTQT
jgi:twitching motility protein PilI